MKDLGMDPNKEDIVEQAEAAGGEEGEQEDDAAE